MKTSSNENGFTFIYQKTSGLFTPQMINLQLMNGVSFSKGCYVGQEVVARTEHLGKLKRHLYRAEVECESPPQPGDKIYQDEQVMGVVTVSAPNKNGGYTLLAVIQDRALEQEKELLLSNKNPLCLCASA